MPQGKDAHLPEKMQKPSDTEWLQSPRMGILDLSSPKEFELGERE
jgi:hypothetical protein